MEEAHRAGVRLGEDPILNVVSAFAGGKEHHSWKTSFSNSFVITFVLVEIVIGILFAIFRYSLERKHLLFICTNVVYSEYGPGATTGAPIDSALDENAKHPYYMDVHVMIFVGFGFLMTFLRKYGYTAVGLTFILGSLSIQVYHLTITFWENVIEGHWHYVIVNITTLIKVFNTSLYHKTSK